MSTDGKKAIDIIVNMEGKAIDTAILTPDGEISFDQVVDIARSDGGLPSGEFIEYEVYYDNAIARPQNGRLYERENVKIQNGTSFNVTYTDKS